MYVAVCACTGMPSGRNRYYKRHHQAIAPQVFRAATAFGTSLFWGGNSVVQDSLVKYLETDETLSFVRAFSEELQHSLASLRNWKSELAFVTQSVPGMGAQAHQVCSACVSQTRTQGHAQFWRTFPKVSTGMVTMGKLLPKGCHELLL